MNKLLITIISFSLVSFATHSQVPKKRLPQNVNVPTYSHVFPSLSGDGNQMIFLTNYTNSEGFETKYTYKTGLETWADPEPLTAINKPGLDHIGSFNLSYDGNFVVFSSRRSPSIGNYDIFISEKIGNYWSIPKNPGKPLNSPANEGNPCLSPDGKSMFFMRCETMDANKKENCAIYVSHRISETRWSEPEALPDYINTGHETTPRILADNKTLVFASKRSGGKGKLDLYSATLHSGKWSKPVPWSFINTPENDEYISIPARGDFIYFTAPYKDQLNLCKAILPESYRPEKVLMLTGNVTYTDGQKPSDDVMVQAFDASTGKVFTTTKLREKDNTFTIFLPEGTLYDVSAFPQKGGHVYYSEIIDLSTMLFSKKEEMTINLSNISPGRSIPISTIRYEDYTATLTNTSETEIKRIVGFLKKNPGIRIEIGAFIDQVYMDSIPSNDLTEVIADTVFYEIEKEDSLTVGELTKTDSNTNLLASSELFEGSSTVHLADAKEQNLHDSIAEDVEEFSEMQDSSGTTEELNIRSDTTGFTEIFSDTVLSEKDSALLLGYQLYVETDETEVFYKVNYTYHNDRTQQQAEALMYKLIQAGVPPRLLEAKGYGDVWLVDRAAEERNYWIELKILND